MSYRVAESTVVGWMSHIFETVEDFQRWARAHPAHGEIESPGLARISGQPFAGTVDHRLDKPQQAEAHEQVESLRLF